MSGADHVSGAADRHRPPRARDFAGQLARVRLLLLLLTLAWGAVVLWLVRVALERADAAAAGMSVVMAIVGAVVFSLLWRLWSRQRPLAGACQRLRDAARAIPAGSAGVWEDSVEDTAVLALARLDGTVSFSLAQEEDLQVLDRVAAGEMSHLISTEIQVLGQAPFVWRLVHADRTTGEGGVPSGSPAARSLMGMAKVVLMQHRTGMMTPSPDELQTLVRRVNEADPMIIPGGRT